MQQWTGTQSLSIMCVCEQCTVPGMQVVYPCALTMARLTDQQGILSRWAEHFHSVLNQTSSFDPSVLNLIPNWAVNMDLIQPPTVVEVHRAVNQMATGKAPGTDGLPAEVLKAGGPNLTTKLAQLFQNIWSKRSVPQEFRDALIVHIFKRKGDCSVCDGHRGISLLWIPGKILGRVSLNRLSKHVDDIGILPERQCGFRAGRSTMDMIFTARQQWRIANGATAPPGLPRTTFVIRADPMTFLGDWVRGRAGVW